MTDPKQKTSSSLREPKPKKKLGLVVPQPLKMPHLDLIHKAPDSPADNKGPVPGESPAANEGPAQIEPLALHEVGPASGIGPASSTGPKREFSLLNSLPDVKGYMLWFHQVTDYLDRQLTPFEQCLYKQLYRLSWGFDQATCIIGFPKLAERTNMSETAARQAAKGLVRKGLVKKRGMVFGKGVEQGIEWEVFSPPALTKHKEDNRGRAARNTGPSINAGQVSKAGPSLSAPIKEINTQKETTQTQSGVGVSSRFKLEECRRYANHLKETGQGITNPGGYATRIFRSGEADTLIEAFLNPQAPLDINQCLECRGTNFIYIDPTDHDKGVRPCRHESLRSLAK